MASAGALSGGEARKQPGGEGQSLGVDRQDLVVVTTEAHVVRVRAVHAAVSRFDGGPQVCSPRGQM